MVNHFKIITSFLFVVWIIGMRISALYALSSGPPDNHTGSPLENYETCNHFGTGCHNSYEPNTGTATFTISAPNRYTLGDTLNITVLFNNSTTAKHGFELSALDADNNYVGTFNTVDSKTQTNSNGNFIKHTSEGSNQSGNASWNITWTAPTSEVQYPVTFYGSGNEANGDGTPLNVYIYTTTAQISNASTTPSATPTPSTTSPPQPTPASECEPNAIVLDSKNVQLKFKEGKTVTITVTGNEGCKSQGVTVNASVKTGKKRVTIDPVSNTTDENGEAEFTVTAVKKKGNAKIVFTVEGSEGEVMDEIFLKVKVRKRG